MSPDLPPLTGAPRVGYVLKMYPRFSETFIVNELLALEATGVEVEVLSLRPPADGRFHAALAQVRAPVTYVPRTSRTEQAWPLLAAARMLPGAQAAWEDLLDADPEDALQAVEVALAVRARRLQHLHAHFGSVATTVTRLAAALAQVPYTFTAHAKDIFHESVDPDDLRRKLRDARAVVTVSDYNRDFLARAYGTDAGRVVRLYNGLDLQRYAWSSPAQRPPVIAAVGRLVEKKGFADLLRAVALLARRRPGLRVDLVGRGPEEGPLRAQAARLGITDVVTFHGALPQDDVVRVVRGAAVLAAPCVVGSDGNRDGLPTVLLEGMALGTPCVATPVTGIPEAVVHERTGLLVPERDVRALAEALARLLDEPDERCRLSVAARALVEAEFDAHRQVRRLRELLVPAPAQAVAA